jgi:hypothetical protein
MVLLPRLVSLMEYPGSQAGHEEEPPSPEDLSMTCSPEGTGDLERLPVELAARPQEGSWRAVGSLLVFPFLLYFCFNLLSSKTPLLVPSSGCQTCGETKRQRNLLWPSGLVLCVRASPVWRVCVSVALFGGEYTPLYRVDLKVG